MKGMTPKLSLAVIIVLMVGGALTPCATCYGDSEQDLLIKYAQNCDRKGLTALLEKGASPNAKRPGDEATLLILSAGCGHADVVRTLLGKGADVNLPNRNGWTPLMAAVAKGHEGVVELLLEHGADPNMRHAYGWTALKLATQKGRKNIADVLRKYGAHK
ncbi:MAG: ankyrin repeat domain-containing protein [Desulfomonilaceae bacterium]